MGSISTGIGLVSGIDSGSLIEQLMQLENRPVRTLQSRIAEASSVQIALTSLSTRVSTLKSSGTELRKPSTFDAVTANSSSDALNVTANAGAPAGRYRVRVGGLVQAQQGISRDGFAEKNSLVGAGTLRLELGNGRLERGIQLSGLNGGEGVAPGEFRITDAAGRGATIDTGGLETLQEVVGAINDSGLDLQASLDDDRIVIADYSGGAGTGSIRDLGGGSAAADLGLTAETGATMSGNVMTGADLVRLRGDELLADLRGGNGIPLGTGTDIRVTDRDGKKHNIDFGSASTVDELIASFNSQTDGKVRLGIDPNGGGALIVSDLTGKNGDLKIESRNSAKTAEALGLVVDAKVDSHVGTALIASAGSVASNDLLGGRGLDDNTIRITDRLGNRADIDGSSFVIGDLIERINDSGIGVRAEYNDAGTGLRLVDTTGGTGDLQVEDRDGGLLAEQLGLAGNHAADEVEGANLQLQWFTRGTKLENLNGTGVSPGDFKITAADGSTGTVKLDEFDDEVGDVIDAINALGIGVTARINDTGDGLLVEDTSGGAGVMKIEDDKGATAEGLRIAGEHATGTADGSYEATLVLDGTETLEDVQQQINELGFAARASLINDGSGDQPWRLSLTGRDEGSRGAFTFDAGATTLGTRRISDASDAVVYLGGDNGLAPLTIRGQTNTIEDVLPGVTLDLVGTNAGQEIEVVISPNQQESFDAVSKLIENFNAFRDTIDDGTGFNPETQERGKLLGLSAVGRVEQQLYRLFNEVYESGNAKYRILADIGIRLGDGAKLELDEEKYRAALADDPEAVKQMFTALGDDDEPNGFGHRLQDVATRLTDPVDGILTQASDVFDDQVSSFEEQIARIEERNEVKRQRLQKQFLDMELALSSLQSQQTAIGQIQSIQAPPSRSNNG
jgi:flagellar hook-associated protein 2